MKSGALTSDKQADQKVRLDVYNIPLTFCTYSGCSWLWDRFFQLWVRYFPSYHGEILSTSNQNYSFPQLTIRPCVCKSDNVCWSNRLRKALQKTKSPFVFLTLDDYYLKSPTNVSKLQQALEAMDQDKKIGYISFEAPHPFRVEPYSRCSFLSYMPKGPRQCVSAQTGLWRVSYLKRVLHSGESAWQFESFGSRRAAFLSKRTLVLTDSHLPIFDYPWGGVIHYGKIMPDWQRFFERNDCVFLKVPQCFLASNENDTASTPTQNSVLKKVTIKNRIHTAVWNLWVNLYVFFSLIFPWKLIPPKT